jgi:phasin
MTEATTRAKPAKPSVNARAAEEPKGETDLPKLEFPQFELPKFELPKFELPKMEMPAAFRAFAERSVAQAREGYERLKQAAEEATDVFEESYATASKGLTEYTLKVIDAARTNANAHFDFASEMLAVRSVSEAVELATAHARKQFDLFMGQSKELTALAQKVAKETVEPLQNGFARTLRQSH